MLRAGWSFVAAALFLIGAASLALTVYLWIGDWPRDVKQVVDHQRSVAENATREPDPLISNVHARRSQSLNGSWRALIDPYGRADLAGMAPLAREPRTPSDLAEFSFENGLGLAVPGDWNSQDPRLVFYRGVVWYKRVFRHAPAPTARQFLWFGAANHRASVYLNGLLLGRHEGGFTPFDFEVTGRLQARENLLVVRVDNEKHADDVPTPTTDWHSYGGLTRDVLLVSLPEIFVRDYEVQLAPASTTRLRGFVALDGARGGEAIELRIPELGVALQLTADESGRAVFELEAAPELWSPASPRLYRVEITGGGDVVSEEIGLRSIEVRGSEILLNGRAIFLRGISLHEEAPRGGGRAHSREHAEELLSWARDLECNFVRLAHYPHSQQMARAADRMGLLVWEEIPVYWQIAFGDERTLVRAKRQLSELIARDRNRASVILWSIANETPFSDERQRFLTALAEHVRAEDASRLVTAALLTPPGEMAEFFLRAYLPALLGLPTADWVYRVSDPLADLVDVQALNEYFGWYYSGAVGLLTPFSSFHARRVMLDNMHRIRFTSASSKPMLISELGAAAKAGWRASEDDLVVFSEDYQALVYRRQIEMLRGQTGISGMSPWILKDFRSPLRLYQGVQDHWDLKGLIADSGQRKQAFEVLRAFYAELAARERGESPDRAKPGDQKG